MIGIVRTVPLIDSVGGNCYTEHESFMRVSVEHIDNVTKRLKVEVPPDVVAKEIESTYHDISHKVKVKGFRPGKAPRAILERYYSEAVKEEVLTKVIGESYREAITQNKVAPVSQPRIEGVTFEEGKGVSYSATVEVKPEVDLREYTGLRLTRRRYSVTDEDVTRAVDELRERNAEVAPTSLVRPLQRGDFALVDYKVLSPEPVGSRVTGAGGKGVKEEVLESKENVLVEVGTGSYPFEGGLVGLEAGQEKDILVTDSSLSTTGIRFRVRVKEVKVKVLPALDDEFSRTAGYNNVRELMESVKKALEENAQRRTEREFREHVTDTLIEKNPVEAPSSMVEGQVDFLVSEMKRFLGPQAGRIDEGKMKTELRPRAVKQVKAGILLDALAGKEGVSVTDEEIDTELEKIARARKERVEAVKERYRREGLIEGLKAEIREEKALRFVVDRAQVTEV